MADQSRLFQAGPDPFGRMWKVQFRWLQTAISIRHADTVDVKFFVTPDGGETEEKVIALQHVDLLRFCQERNLKPSDGFCMRISAAHLKRMIETSEDMDKTLVTMRYSEFAASERDLQGVTVS